MLPRIVYRFHKAILVTACALTLFALYFSTRIKLDADLFALLPAHHPSTQTFFEVTEAVGMQSLLIVLLEMPAHIDRVKSEAFADLLAGYLADSPLISEVEYRAEGLDLSYFLRLLTEHLPLFLPSRDLDHLVSKLSDEGIRKQVQENKRLLMSPLGVAAREWVYHDPLALRDLMETRATLVPGKTGARSFEGYFRTGDGLTYFLLARPKKPPQDIAFSKEVMAEARRLEKKALSVFSQKYGNPAEEIRVAYAGGYAIAVHDEAVTKKDIQLMIVSSFLGVMVLFGICFRSFRILVFVSVTMVLSLLWTLGLAALAFQRLNLLTCVFSCVLVGLGIDFAIHVINRYFGPDKAGLDGRERLVRTFQEIGQGLTLGAVTTAVAFYCLAVSDFRAFQELGILTGTGILICLAVMVFVLPSILLLFSGTEAGGAKISIAGFGLKPILKAVTGYPWVFLAGTVLISGMLGWLGTGIPFDDNLKNFRVPDSEVFRAQDKFTAWLGGSGAEVLIVAQGRSESEAMEVDAMVCRTLEEMRESGEIAGFRSLSQFVLPPSHQEETLAFIRNHPSHFDMNRIRKTFYEALEEYGFKPSEAYGSYLESLSRSLAAEQPLLLSTLKGAGIEKLLKLFRYRKDGTVKTVTYVIPAKDLWADADTFRFSGGIDRRLSEKGLTKESASLTGVSLLTADLKSLIIRNLKSSLWLAFGGVILVLLIGYRQALLVIPSLSPLALGLVSLIGIMVAFGVSFNLINIIVLTMLVGIGVDNGVYLTNAFRAADNASVLEELVHAGRAIVLCSLTTIVGFGSIALSHYPGLQSMGYVAVIGMGGILLTSIFTLPALLAILRRLGRV